MIYRYRRKASNSRGLRIILQYTYAVLAFETLLRLDVNPDKIAAIRFNDPNPFISSAATYESPPAYHFLRWSRNILSDPPDTFTTEVERLIEVRRGFLVPTSRTHLVRPGAWTPHNGFFVLLLRRKERITKKNASNAVVLQRPYLKLMLTTKVENPHCPSFRPTPQENRSPMRLKDESKVRAYAAIKKSP
ncbi:hypothetical protein EVAR_12683_1 [Eumeta japonica]|uniref:Uncharacterized protein n=1 Tax=Eumeta variegata TaxID=151549 RepID=A0A4C1UMT9_EUMVA|nr:hypothetical protein EVAR_12683_1 [Eumeta japonica]